MTDIDIQDAQLRELFAADLPPARDPVFVLSVLRRVEKRRLRAQAGMLAVNAVAAGALIYGLSPVATTVLGNNAANSMLAVTLVLMSLWPLRRYIPGARYLLPR